MPGSVIFRQSIHQDVYVEITNIGVDNYEALVFRLVRSFLLRHENWRARSQLKLYWTFFMIGFMVPNVDRK
jgi:hypothetical protein